MTASRPSYQRDPRVDAYVDALPDWQRAICRRLCDLIHAADPELVETSDDSRRCKVVCRRR